VAHGDYVLTVEGVSYPMAASCWLGGERGKGCAAFSDSESYTLFSARKPAFPVWADSFRVRVRVRVGVRVRAN